MTCLSNWLSIPIPQSNLGCRLSTKIAVLFHSAFYCMCSVNSSPVKNVHNSNNWYIIKLYLYNRSRQYQLLLLWTDVIWLIMFVETYIWVDLGVACSEGTLFVQQHATVSGALIQFLLFFITLRSGGVWFLASVNTAISSTTFKLCMCWFICLFP